MQLYSGNSLQFIQDTTQNQIAEKLRRSFFNHYRFYPSDQEVRSWHNSLSRMKDVFQEASLNDHGIVLEYQLPLTSKRLDCMVSGRNEENSDNAVIVELKQWDKCAPADGENEVETWVGGACRPILHPSIQVQRYQMYLSDCHTAFHEGPSPVALSACSYLHNYGYQDKDPLLDRKFRKAIADTPLFSKDDFEPICRYLSQRLSQGHGAEVMDRIQSSRFRASKKLMEHVAGIIRQKPEYVLLDEQQVVYDQVRLAAVRARGSAKKRIIIVKGGPGTGKSVIAINLMADLYKKEFQTHYATGSRAFTETLRKVIGSRGASQIKYFNSYATAGPDELDVLILDEAHRIRETSASRFTPKSKRTGLPQIDELLNAAKVTVFFIDDHQVVRPGEIGSTRYLYEAAKQRNCEVEEYELEAQFRCAGSDAFVNWINNTLGIKRTANVLWEGDDRFEFKIFDSAEELDSAIRQKAADGAKARLTAGFCWPWSDPRADGTLEDDVKIGDFKRPWDAKPDATRLAPGIPKASLWAHDPNGINQVGCVYTAQGFEFDYVGVIIGKDLYYDWPINDWKGRPEHSADNVVRRGRERFVDLVKNTYRVLLTRGLKGCYVYFVDEETRRFFASRMELPQPTPAMSTAPERGLIIETDLGRSFQFKTHLPVLSLAAAAGSFSRDQSVEPLGWTKVNEKFRLAEDMFVARVVGQSMEPTIPDGSYCIFRWNPKGSRNGKVVLVESRLVSDPETSGKYTVKRYHSEVELFDDGTWRHKRITLTPDNTAFDPIELQDVDGDAFRVVAEFISVLAEKDR